MINNCPLVPLVVVQILRGRSFGFLRAQHNERRGFCQGFGQEIGRVHNVAKPLGFQGNGYPICWQNWAWP